MWNAILNEDEHTALDGSYARVMKSRKWVFISCLLVSISSYDLFDSASFKKTTQFIYVPDWLLYQASLLGLLYSSLCYFLVWIQFLSSYDQTLKSRMAFKKSEELDEVKVAIKAVSEKIEQAMNRNFELSVLKSRKDELSKAVSIIKDHKDSIDHAFNKHPSKLIDAEIFDEYENVINPVNSKLKEAEREFSKISNKIILLESEDNEAEEVYLLKKDYGDLNVKYKSILKQDLSMRPGFVIPEIGIDFVRSLAPLALAIFSGYLALT